MLIHPTREEEWEREDTWLQGTCTKEPQRHLLNCVHGSTAHNSWGLEPAYMPISRWTDIYMEHIILTIIPPQRIKLWHWKWMEREVIVLVKSSKSRQILHVSSHTWSLDLHIHVHLCGEAQKQKTDRREGKGLKEEKGQDEVREHILSRSRKELEGGGGTGSGGDSGGPWKNK